MAVQSTADTHHPIAVTTCAPPVPAVGESHTCHLPQLPAPVAPAAAASLRPPTAPAPPLRRRHVPEPPCQAPPHLRQAPRPPAARHLVLHSRVPLQAHPAQPPRRAASWVRCRQRLAAPSGMIHSVPPTGTRGGPTGAELRPLPRCMHETVRRPTVTPCMALPGIITGWHMALCDARVAAFTPHSEMGPH